MLKHQTDGQTAELDDLLGGNATKPFRGRPPRESGAKGLTTTPCVSATQPLTGPIPEGRTFCPHCGALYSVTYSRLSKSDSNIDVPLARPVRAASITSAR
jgi:hypothetical protein